MTPQPTILLHWDKDGEFTWGATPEVRVVCVAEYAPNDRVYTTTGSMTQDWIDGVAAGADPRTPV